MPGYSACINCGTRCDLRAKRCLACYQEHRLSLDPELRFWRYVDKTEGGCWLWTGAEANGYGRFSLRGRVVPAHRFAYERLIGSVPEGLTIDHLCRRPACVNPDHLEPVTGRENTQRGLRGRMVTACVRGHPYTPENTRWKKNGTRQCRACEPLWPSRQRKALAA
jgi:hypothetical protein